MSDLKFSCPQCQQHIQCEENYAGTEITCPACSARMMVPGVARTPPPSANACPSCGLRGMVLESWHYHPMGLLILVLFVGMAVASLLPRATHEKFVSYLETHALVFNLICVLFVATFITFGVARAVFQQ